MTPSSTAESTATEIRHSIRPWSSFLSLSSFSLPLSLPDLSLSFNNNLYTFRANYTILSLLIFILTLIFRPITAIIFLILIATWIYLLVARDTPLVVLDFEIGDRMVLIAFSVITIVSVAVAGVWWNLFVSILISVLVISLHAILMTPDDSESPYGALLNVVDEDGPSGGAYMQIDL
ncbi:putative prenylated rab acceptor P [Helianthus annuus]|nr:putative prenylated rab acceptor P [Helianthus annuus]